MRFARDERGSAIVEFIVVMLLAVLPIAYLVIAVVRVQAATYAASQAVREAGRAFIQADGVGSARSTARSAAVLAFADQGFELPPSAVSFTCEHNPCLTPSSTVTVSLNWRVPLPLIPTSLSDGTPASVGIHADHLVTVDTYRSGT